MKTLLKRTLAGLVSLVLVAQPLSPMSEKGGDFVFPLTKKATLSVNWTSEALTLKNVFATSPALPCAASIPVFKTLGAAPSHLPLLDTAPHVGLLFQPQYLLLMIVMFAVVAIGVMFLYFYLTGQEGANTSKVIQKYMVQDVRTTRTAAYVRHANEVYSALRKDLSAKDALAALELILEYYRQHDGIGADLKHYEPAVRTSEFADNPDLVKKGGFIYPAYLAMAARQLEAHPKYFEGYKSEQLKGRVAEFMKFANSGSVMMSEEELMDYFVMIMKTDPAGKWLIYEKLPHWDEWLAELKADVRAGRISMRGPQVQVIFSLGEFANRDRDSKADSSEGESPFEDYRSQMDAIAPLPRVFVERMGLLHRSANAFVRVMNPETQEFEYVMFVRHLSEYTPDGMPAAHYLTIPGGKILWQEDKGGKKTFTRVLRSRFGVTWNYVRGVTSDTMNQLANEQGVGAHETQFERDHQRRQLWVIDLPPSDWYVIQESRRKLDEARRSRTPEEFEAYLKGDPADFPDAYGIELIPLSRLSSLSDVPLTLSYTFKGKQVESFVAAPTPDLLATYVDTRSSNVLNVLMGWAATRREDLAAAEKNSHVDAYAFISSIFAMLLTSLVYSDPRLAPLSDYLPSSGTTLGWLSIVGLVVTVGVMIGSFYLEKPGKDAGLTLRSA